MTIPMAALAWLALTTAGLAAGPSFSTSIEEARKSDSPSGETVLYFSASWCGWCRRMEADVFPHVDVAKAVAERAWVKIDIEEHPELAARYRIRSVPALVRLGRSDVVLGTAVGRLSPERLREFLRPSVRDDSDNAAPHTETNGRRVERTIDDLRAGIARGEPDDIAIAIDRLSRADRAFRADLLSAFTDAERTAWPALWQAMQSDRLSQRAAAAEALETATRAGLPFHPFATRETRRQQAAAWKQWLLDHGAAWPAEPAEAEIPETPWELEKRPE